MTSSAHGPTRDSALSFAPSRRAGQVPICDRQSKRRSRRRSEGASDRGSPAHRAGIRATLIARSATRFTRTVSRGFPRTERGRLQPAVVSFPPLPFAPVPTRFHCGIRTMPASRGDVAEPARREPVPLRGVDDGRGVRLGHHHAEPDPHVEHGVHLGRRDRRPSRRSPRRRRATRGSRRARSRPLPRRGRGSCSRRR